jgi:hypothetical protein
MTDNQGIATCSKTTFRLECDVLINIKASQERIWNLLTSAGDYPKWNSTILTQRPDGSTDFRRVDVYAGLLFPLIAGSHPDFKAIFELLAVELKAEAEKSP